MIQSLQSTAADYFLEGGLSPVARNLCFLSDDELASGDIAELNLEIARGLPGIEDLDIKTCLKKLDYWAQQIRQNTEKWRPKFLKSPGRYHNSYSDFCMEALVTVLQVRLGVKYNLSFSEGEYYGIDPPAM
jgi:hypothetical protein